MQGRILHLSDIHFGCENKGAVAAVAELANSQAVDLVAITGDITQYGRKTEFAAAAAFVRALLPPKLITPGNHDVPYAHPERLIAPFRRYEGCFGDAWMTAFDKEGLAVRAFNSSRGTQVRLNWSKGSVWPDQAREAVPDGRSSASPLRSGAPPAPACRSGPFPPQAPPPEGAAHR